MSIMVYGIVVVVALLCAITGITTGNNITALADENTNTTTTTTTTTNQIYEDQLLVCNFEQVCQIINIDNYMNRQASDNLWNNFNKNLDTFDLKEFE